MFDISQYEAQDTAILEVKNPAGEPLLGADGKPVTIELYGPGSEAHQKAQARFERAAQAAAFAALRNKRGNEDDATTQQVDKLTACTKAISSNFPVAAADLYGNSKLGWITNQVERFIGAWSNFLPQFARD